MMIDRREARRERLHQPANVVFNGRQTVLDCTVRSVTYTSDGIFRNLAVDLVVKRKP